ncbi:MAG: hypothetical protein HC915_18265 [Anaerolineae bacterium]|nr:hypothetical protein [Anaerolineae bacterium]
MRDSVDQAIRHIERSGLPTRTQGRIVREIAPDLPLVHSDKRALARILQLLLDNALKFDPNENSVIIRAQPHSAEHIWLGVVDQGIGIARDQQELIFREFYQIDSSTTRRFGGSGVGLALVKLLCDRLNLSIQVESRPNKGSVFSLLLPIGQLEL